MRQRDEPRDEAGADGDEAGAVDLAAEVREMRLQQQDLAQQLRRNQAKTRTLVRVLANIAATTSAEMERLLVD